MSSTRSAGPVMVAPVVTILLVTFFSANYYSTASSCSSRPIYYHPVAESAQPNLQPRHTFFPHITIFLPETPTVCTKEPFHQSIFNYPSTTAVGTTIAPHSGVKSSLRLFLAFLLSLPNVFKLQAELPDVAVGHSSTPMDPHNAPRKMLVTAARVSRTPPSTCLHSPSPSACAFPFFSPFLIFISAPNAFS